jgi:hypothetical protein
VTPALRREFLANQATLPYFMRLEAVAPAARTAPFQPEIPKDVERAVARWESIPAGTRQRMYNNFRKFFELSQPDRDKTLRTLNDDERKQMEAALQLFGKLPEADRDRCIDSFRKFANLRPDERAQFLQYAGRWQKMSGPERKEWLEVVEKLPAVPPLPPGLQPPFPPMPPPPMPGDSPALPPVPSPGQP